MTAEKFCQTLGLRLPVLCGAMYPCSNPELLVSVAKAGALPIIQPMSLLYVHKEKDLRIALQKMKAQAPTGVFGFNAIVEKTSKVYEDRMRQWVDIALGEGIRFFVSALGKPDWVVEKVHAKGGLVFHDVINRKWAERALAEGVDGLIAVNRDAGGHAGTQSASELFHELSQLRTKRGEVVPLICAGGVGAEDRFRNALEIGYCGVQMGTRFIASQECNAHQDYKNAIVQAQAKDIVHTERVTSVPLAVIQTPYVLKVGTKAGFIARFFLQFRQTRHWVRAYFGLRAMWRMRQSLFRPMNSKDYYQAGRSVEGIDSVLSVAQILAPFEKWFSNRVRNSGL